MKLFLFAMVLVAACVAPVRADEAEAKGYLAKAYPAAEKGMARFAIILPPQKNEENFKVELIVGKKMMADSVNHFGLGGKIEEVNIDGWGFSRYVVKEVGGMFGTLIGGGEPQERWVQMPSIMVRYNSRLPIAVYVPEGAEVKYRIWSVEPEAKVMPKG